MSVLPDRQVINQLISGHYGDPFSILGMHETSQGLQICALLPDAREVWLVETENGRRIAQLTLEDPRGFFIAQLTRRKKSFRYQFAVTWQENPQIIEDPYRFGPLLQDIDSWLLAEGTHLRPYERLGAHLMSLDGVSGVSFAVGHRMLSGYPWWGILTFGMAAAIRCAYGVKMAFGSYFCQE